MLTKDKFGDSMFAEMYSNHRKMDLEAFRTYCCELIQNNTVSSKLKKTQFTLAIEACRTKDQMVKKITNIMLAGEGLSVGTAWTA